VAESHVLVAESQARIDPSHHIASHSSAPKLSKPSFDADEARRRLAQVVGDENIAASLNPASLEVAPASAEEACEVLRLAASEGWTVVPSGAGTWLDVGNPMRRADVIVSTRRMQRIIEHEPTDLIAIAEAGVTLDALNAELGRAGQWLPLDPPDDGRATIGGVVATGMSGAQCFGYGRPRSSVIGMRVALADGRIVKAGGRVVKNVAGYDLCKLFTGSYGTLGLILELTFKLKPRPMQTATIAASASLDSLFRSARAVLDARLLPVAIELLSSSAAARIGVSDEDAHPALLIRYAGMPETIAFQTAETAKLLRNAGATVISDASDDDEYWRKLSALPLDDENQLIWRASMKPTEIETFLNQTMRDGGSTSSSSSLWHAGVGDGRLRVMNPLMDDAVSCVASLERLRVQARALGGSFVIESAPMKIKNAIDVFDVPGASASLMQRIKHQLDPADTLSPGRFANQQAALTQTPNLC
ncbi:MAG: glycolate oxidase binding subunit, partial [Acidobacteriota bacterium]|nr:glycolate oxidase binding subunit [Acidobacteriota bacterium]